MECNNDFRHVCQKDLQNYMKRDSYFSDFSAEEIATIQKNLGIVTQIDPKYSPTVIQGTHSDIYNQMLNSSLKLGFIYVMTDFRTIYADINGKTCGIESHIPSKQYQLILIPTTTSSFSERVGLIGASDCGTWEVRYDIKPSVMPDGTSNKGTITYLKDSRNNSACYDFKNIKFLKTISELNKGATTYSGDTYLYTFDNDGTDASETICKNNHLEYGASRNVFLGNTQNVTMAADCHDNIFFKNCENCTFDYGTYGNFFKDDAKRCKGSVHEKELDSITSQNSPKQFDVLDGDEVMTYLDSQTQTYQFKRL